MECVKRAFHEHAETMRKTMETLSDKIEQAAQTLIACYRADKKVVLFGNGGSAADALHIEGELLCRFRKDREGLPALAIGSGLSALTATSNDYSYDEALSRLVKASVRSGDVALAISTSGNSQNIVKAAETAKKMGAHVIALTGESGGLLKKQSALLLNVPSIDTARIQEAHIMIGHILCEIVESELFGGD